MNIELYSLSCFQFKTSSQKDITFTCKCSSLHELFWRKDLFFPNLSPLVVLLSGYGEGLVIHTLQKAKLLLFEGTFPFGKFTSLCSENRGLWIDSNASQFCNETTKEIKKCLGVGGERERGRETGGGSSAPGGCSTKFVRGAPPQRPTLYPFIYHHF